MICPLCRHRSKAGAHACAACGVDFMKWLHLQGGKAAARRRHPPHPRSLPPAARAAAAAGLVAFLALAFWRARGADASSSPATGSAAAAAAPAPAVDRLSDIHGKALAEGRLYGVELMRDELERRYEQGGRAFSDEALAAVAAEAGVAPPREVPLRDDEAALMAKCRKGGAWAYGSLPARPEAGVECWAAGVGYPRRWVLQHWSPKRKMWSAFPEADAARAVRRILQVNFPPEREQAVRDAADLALAQPGADRRRALLAYYGYLAEREGAMAALTRF